MTALPEARGIDVESATELLRALIDIPSVNPAYDPASPGENAVGDAILAFCARLGMSGSSVAVVDGRRNIQARLSSAQPHRTLLIEAHIDTVGLSAAPGLMPSSVEGGRIRGRGACDVKGGIAAALLA